jgi:dolichyl-phosphate beta-glucosyltransferase
LPELAPDALPFLSAVLPAYNEAASIRRTLTQMRAFLDAQSYSYEIIVAADGDDDTPAIVAELAEDWPALHLTAEPGRHGKGHGLRRGMALARGEIVGFLDADYKTEIDELTKVLPWFDQGYDLVAGSRGLAESRIDRHQPLYRQVGSRLFAVAMHTIVGLNELHDTQCGFKFFTRDAARQIFSRARIDGYMCDVEILYLAEKLGLRVREIGINWRDDGDSRLQLVSGNLRNARDLFVIRFGRYGARPVAVPTVAKVASRG